jgi:hypothetical protein
MIFPSASLRKRGRPRLASARYGARQRCLGNCGFHHLQAEEHKVPRGLCALPLVRRAACLCAPFGSVQQQVRLFDQLRQAFQETSTLSTIHQTVIQ